MEQIINFLTDWIYWPYTIGVMLLSSLIIVFVVKNPTSLGKRLITALAGLLLWLAYWWFDDAFDWRMTLNGFAAAVLFYTFFFERWIKPHIDKKKEWGWFIPFLSGKETPKLKEGK